MKTIFFLFLFTVSAGIAHAQDAVCTTGQPADCQTPAVVYEAPVVYTAPVVYQAPVVYYAPVYYTTPANCTPTAACEAPAALSTVTYIGGGHVGYQTSRCNSGSTVTYIGGHSRFH